MFRILSQIWRLMALCISGPGGKVGLVLFVVVVTLDLGSVYASVRLIEWTGAFYGALEKVDAEEAVRQVGIFGIIVALNSARHLLGQYVRKHLEMRWRRTLTQKALDIWLANKAYWHLATSTYPHWNDTTNGPRGHHIDNPDQRIAEDCRLFLEGLLTEALDFISRVVGLFSYIALLWSLASFPLSLAFIGLPVEIPHYMIWAAFIYVAISSLLTHVLGFPLKGLIVEQQRREANFRFALARLRSNFEEVALIGGEAAERREFQSRFDAIVGNWRKLVNRDLILGCFTYPFNHSVLRIPLFVALPGYLAGHVAFGGLMQLSSAFSNVVTTLSWFVFSYRDLADLVAASSRLDGFLQAAGSAGSQRPAIERAPSPDGNLHAGALAIRSPEGKPIIAVGAFSAGRGETIWLRGPSGLGKTTLLKAIAGLWPYGEGRIELPEAGLMFSPQRPYFPIGDIYSAVAYPEPVDAYSREELENVLRQVGLAHRIGVEFGRSDTREGHGLSGGEQQRLILARVILHKPDWVLLDEPTSALDTDAEAELLALLRASLVGSTIVIVAHRQLRGLDDVRTINLKNRPAATPRPTLQPA